MGRHTCTRVLIRCSPRPVAMMLVVLISDPFQTTSLLALVITTEYTTSTPTSGPTQVMFASVPAELGDTIMLDTPPGAVGVNRNVYILILWYKHNHLIFLEFELHM